MPTPDGVGIFILAYRVVGLWVARSRNNPHHYMGRIDWISLAHRQAGLEATQKLQVADKLAYYGIQTSCPQIVLWADDSHKIGAPLKTKLLTTALNNAIID